ncbi:MAG TPA: AraC family transcriptional regulator [Ideonella sp.]|uniref:AraC family transcriptional regulator n=1 Tax=Ideonella sp. TaxID=1929293 RepID=UPI002C9D9F8A|nr:AraC family transcriptional regulator [Ideonella sp.]HSI46683.1 AraC family transcriptional regulator [Ideonella sp.]
MPAPSPLPPPGHVLTGRDRLWQGRRTIEDYVDQLNQFSPDASRRISSWGAEPGATLAVASVAMDRRQPGDEALLPPLFLSEGRLSFGLTLQGGNPQAAPSVYVIGLPLAGQITAQLSNQPACVAHAGEGLILDPAEVRSFGLSPGVHCVEFCLPKRDVARLAGDWQPGVQGSHPRFAPRLAAPLAQRLLFMAAQAADSLQPPGGQPGSPMMFRRWCEMIALTLLHEQPQRQPGLPKPRGTVGQAAPASLRRAIDYIHAHAEGAIGLADIADAACLSVSSLVRQFNAQLGASPYSYLKTVRLERARRELLGRPDLLIRDVALRWGFQNASKFSQAYRLQFGELPSATQLQRAVT